MSSQHALVSQVAIETLASVVAGAGVSQDVVEVLQEFTPPTPYVPGAIPVMAPGTYGDLCDTETLDGGWTLRNIASVGGVDDSTTSLIPGMSSDTFPRGIASASEWNATTPAWHAFAGYSGWITNASALPQWLAYEFTVATTVNAYAIKPWWVDSYPGRTPADWKLQGTNDGTTWDDLDTRTGWSPASATVYEVFAVSSPGSYLKYRLYITANHGNSYTGVGGWKLLASGLHRYSVTFDAVGDAMTRAFTDSAQDFCLTVRITGQVSRASDVGLCALDASGTGMSFFIDNDSGGYCLLYRTSAWGIGSGWQSVGGPYYSDDYWIQMRRISGDYSGRCSSDGTNWSAWTAVLNDSRTITQIGLLKFYSEGPTETLGVGPFMYGLTTGDLVYSNTDNPVVVGQRVVEALVSFDPSVSVSQNCIEVLMDLAGSVPPELGGVYGFAG